MFQPEYVQALIEMGERDARERADELIPFLQDQDTPASLEKRNHS